jgi:hypothetical protein
MPRGLGLGPEKPSRLLSTPERQCMKQELYKLLERLRSANDALSEHEFEFLADRLFVNEVLRKDIARAISVAEYLESMVS